MPRARQESHPDNATWHHGSTSACHLGIHQPALSEVGTYVSPQSRRVHSSIQDAALTVSHLHCCYALLTVLSCGCATPVRTAKGLLHPVHHAHAQQPRREPQNMRTCTEGCSAAPPAQRSPATGGAGAAVKAPCAYGAPALRAFPAEAPSHLPHRAMRERPWQVIASSLHAMPWPPGAGKPCSRRSILHGLLRSMLSAAHLVPLWLKIRAAALCCAMGLAVLSLACSGQQSCCHRNTSEEGRGTLS